MLSDAHQHLLTQLGMLLGNAPIVADDHGSAGVALSDGSSIGIQIDVPADELWLYADLGAVPDVPDVAEELLRMQLFGRHTGGGAIAIGPGLAGEPRLVLWRSLPIAGFDARMLSAMITRLGDAAAAWRESLDRLTTSESSDLPRSVIPGGAEPAAIPSLPHGGFA